VSRLARICTLAVALICTFSLGATFFPALVDAAENGEADDDADSLRAATQNPISSLISLPFKFSFDNGADNGDANFLFIQPVIPVTVGDWNLVNRMIVPVVDAPGGVSGLAAIPNPPWVADGSGWATSTTRCSSTRSKHHCPSSGA
jgi:hypothetical protein